MATLSRDEARTAAARKGQARAMEHRKCPECGRGNALTKVSQPDLWGRKCRYCTYERYVTIYDQKLGDSNATP